MTKQRIIACLLIDGEYVVMSYGFSKYRRVGKIGVTVKHLDLWGADEIVILNKSGNFNDLKRAILAASSNCRIPIVAGGGIKNFNDAKELFKSGADRLCLESLIRNKSEKILHKISIIYGGQSIIVRAPYNKNGIVRKTDQNIKDYLAERQTMLNDHHINDIMLWSMYSDGFENEHDLFYLNNLSVEGSLIIGGGVTNETIDQINNISNDRVISLAICNELFFGENIIYKIKKRAKMKRLGIQ